jgi:hypothetical protein
VKYMVSLHSQSSSCVDGLECKIYTAVASEMFNVKCLHWKIDHCYLLFYELSGPHKPWCVLMWLCKFLF